MDSHITELEDLLRELERAKLPTTKAGIGERALKVMAPLVIQQHAEIAQLKARLNQCQK